MDFPRKSERIAVKESLQDVFKFPVSMANNSENAVNVPKKKEIEKSSGDQSELPVTKQKRTSQVKTTTTKKRSCVRKKPFISKKAKIKQNHEDEPKLIRADIPIEVEVMVSKPRKQRAAIELNALVNFDAGWKDNQLHHEMKKLDIKTLTNYDSIDFGNNENMLKISSWNIDGVDRLISRGGLEFFLREKSEVFCLQNLKCSNGKELRSKLSFDGYEAYFNLRVGLPGIGILTKIAPLSVIMETEVEELDEENSVMVMEFENFLLLCVAAPSAGFGLKKLEKKMSWQDSFNEYIEELQEQPKPLVIAGNFQTALHEIGKLGYKDFRYKIMKSQKLADIANPKYSRKQAGYTEEESERMNDLLDLDLIDTFRKFHPEDREGFTCFTNYPDHGHLVEHGSRIDYVLVSQELQENVMNSVIRSDIVDFTHSPLTMFMMF